MKSIGVLGGTRFIGYHLTRTLLESGHRVTLFHRGRTAAPGPLASPFLRHVYGDRDRPADLGEFLHERYDAVFDLSGYSPRHVRPLLDERLRSRIGHYIFCSTSSVYAVPPPCPHTESAPRTTVAGTYGGDKALVEDLVMAEWGRSGWPVTILRPQGVFGRFDAAQAAFVFARLVNSLPILLGPRRRYRLSFAYVSDLVRAFVRAMSQPRAHGRIYDVAGDDVVTQTEFVELCAAAASLRPEVRVLECEDDARWPIGLPWPGHHLVADSRLVKRELDVDFTPLRRALEETWDWLRATPAHLQPHLFRGEELLRENRPIRAWRRTLWRVEDVLRASAMTRPAVSRLGRLLRRVRTVARRGRAPGALSRVSAAL